MSTVHALPSVEQMLASLIGEPSVSSLEPTLDCSNLRVLECLGNWMDGLGFTTELLPLPENSNKANLIATLGSGDGGLVLAGHTDTVPYDATRWNHDPFTLCEENDRFYGLGTCDMKGFFPIVLQALTQLDTNKLSKPLTIVATSDEESSMAGARHLLASGKPRAEFAIIGEPTSLRPIYAHKGIAFLTISLKGRSGHSSNPDLGCNALDAMHTVMGELIRFREALAERHQNPAFDVHIPTLNLGCMHAGDSPNRICSTAALQIDLRLLPGMDTDATLDQLRDDLEQVLCDCDAELTIQPHYPPVPPFESNPQGQLVNTLAEFTGQAPGTVAFGTEGHFLQSLGMETVVCGPGSIDQAHQPDEYISRGQIATADTVFGKVVHQYCMG